MIVFNRKDTLTLTYKQTTAKRKEDPMFALKAILLYIALAAVLGISRAQEKSDQKHLPGNQPRYRAKRRS